MEYLKKIMSNKTNILIVLLCVVFCFQIFNYFNIESDSSKVDYIEKEISNLKKDVDSIYKSEIASEKKISEFNKSIKDINEDIEINNAKIEKLKNYEKIKIDNFKSYDAIMWEKYFTERYSKKNRPSNGAEK